LALLLLTSCSHADRRVEPRPLVVEQVNAAAVGPGADEALSKACRDWRLDSAQVEQFFALSAQYPNAKPHEFYDLPCTISGTLKAEGRRWDFTINAAATATWRSGSDTRYWGCRSVKCEPLVLLAPDGMAPN
jgi:hypothetical protein